MGRRHMLGPLTAGVVLPVLLSSAGCVIATERVNNDCGWMSDPPRALTEASAVDRRHLATDTTVAEELAIRYADTHRGFRSAGQYVGQAEYARARTQCLETLVSTIAERHGLAIDDVRNSLHRRVAWYDVVLVFLPVGLVVCLASDELLRRVYRRFTRDETIPRVLGTVLASAAIAILGSQVGSMQSFIVEERLILRTNHLSYRAAATPWARHSAAAVAVVIALFWIVALVRSRSGSTRSLLNVARDLLIQSERRS
jgi:hypothetical protein